MESQEQNYMYTDIAMDTQIGEPYDYEAENKAVWDKIYSKEKSKSKYGTRYTPPKKRNRKK